MILPLLAGLAPALRSALQETLHVLIGLAAAAVTYAVLAGARVLIQRNLLSSQNEVLKRLGKTAEDAVRFVEQTARKAIDPEKPRPLTLTEAAGLAQQAVDFVVRALPSATARVAQEALGGMSVETYLRQLIEAKVQKLKREAPVLITEEVPSTTPASPTGSN